MRGAGIPRFKTPSRIRIAGVSLQASYSSQRLREKPYSGNERARGFAMSVPLYSSDLALLDVISEKRALRLEDCGLAKVVRHKGHINRVVFYRRPDDPLPATARDLSGERILVRATPRRRPSLLEAPAAARWALRFDACARGNAWHLRKRSARLHCLNRPRPRRFAGPDLQGGGRGSNGGASLPS